VRVFPVPGGPLKRATKPLPTSQLGYGPRHVSCHTFAGNDVLPYMFHLFMVLDQVTKQVFRVISEHELLISLIVPFDSVNMVDVERACLLLHTNAVALFVTTYEIPDPSKNSRARKAPEEEANRVSSSATACWSRYAVRMDGGRWSFHGVVLVSHPRRNQCFPIGRPL
jgi:hypothetical protein